MRAFLSLTVVLAACQFSTAADAPAKPRPAPKPIPVLTQLPNSIHERVAKLAEDRKAIQADMLEAQAANTAALGRLLPSLDVLKTKESRDALRAETVPVLRQAAQLDIEISRFVTTQPGVLPSPIGPVSPGERLHWLAVLMTAIGDPEGAAQLSEFTGIQPGAMITPSEIITSDEATQRTIVETLKARIAEAPTDDAATQAAILILRRKLVADSTAADSLFACLKQNGPASTPMVRMYLSRADLDARKKALAADVGAKQCVLEGTLVTGKAFSTADWKGKVVLVDFWATWCGPCKAELPRIKALYKQYQAQGLEIIGVSNDYAQKALEKYVAADPDMPWPQLFDPASAEANLWHPTTRQFGINSIPTMFLIDRKGVLRSIAARAELESLIPKLLAEPAE